MKGIAQASAHLEELQYGKQNDTAQIAMPRKKPPS
jgi:hypothetical protein